MQNAGRGGLAVRGLRGRSGAETAKKSREMRRPHPGPGTPGVVGVVFGGSLTLEGGACQPTMKPSSSRSAVRRSST